MFKNIISLGSYCGPAMELERIGLRKASYPFDWVISEWEGVEHEIENKFQDFLAENLLWQFADMPGRYKNVSIGISFFHDFNKYESLSNQINDVKTKYDRRIKRFYKDITEDTLFIRYVASAQELDYWKKHYDRVSCFFKEYNSNNQIWLIQTYDSDCCIKDSYYVEPDEGDAIARDLFLEKMPELKAILMSDEIYDCNERERNLAVYREKKKNQNTIKSISSYRLTQIRNSLFKKIYIHDKVLQGYDMGDSEY